MEFLIGSFVGVTTGALIGIIVTRMYYRGW